MSDTTTIWCLVEGDSSPFSIAASSGTYIADLKNLIKEEKRGLPSLEWVDASDLTVWKVNVGLNAVNLKDKILCRKYRPKSLRSVTSIFEVLRIFEVWPESPPDGYLHVFITLPKQYNNPTNWVTPRYLSRYPPPFNTFIPPPGPGNRLYQINTSKPYTIHYMGHGQDLDL